LTNKKNILHVINSLGRGGAEHLLVNYVNELKQYNNYILYFQEPHDLKSQIKNTQVIYLHKKEGNAFSIVRHIRKVIRDEKIDIVHAHCYWSNIYSRIATPSRVKLINHYHFATYDTMKYENKLKVRLLLDKLTYSTHINIIAVSAYVESILHRECGFHENIETIRNFIGDNFYKSNAKQKAIWTKGEPLKLIAIGSLKKEKNYELLIDAFKVLKDFPVSIDVYGGGERLDWFKKETEKYGIKNLRFLGNHSNVQSLFDNYHGYVMCSFSEACPLSPLEAMSCGLPVILSDIPSLKEIVGENSGMYFENKKAKSFISLIQSILSGDTILDGHKSAYADILSHYSKEYFIKKLTDLYEK